MRAEKLNKAAQTRAKIVEVSMKLFLDQGFQKTTMREIARAAGLAQGAAYYHFESKEHLIFDFYQRSYDEQLPLAEKVLAKEKDLAARLAGVVKAHLEVAEPYHEISTVLFKTAADPSDPLSPFSERSKELRDKNIALMGRVLEGHSSAQALGKALPELLWLYKMAMILYWIHDRSPKRKKSRDLVDKTSRLVAELLRLARVPGMGGMTKKLLQMFEEFKPF